MQPPKPLVLGSSSPYRKTLLSRLGLPFVIASPEIDETPCTGENGEATSLRLAIAKARSLSGRFKNSLIIGSDQVACLENQQLGKPHTHERAMAQLLAMSGKIVTFYTAVCVYNTQSQQIHTTIDKTKVTMRSYSHLEAENYLLREQPYDCAGSAKMESLGIVLVAKIDTTDPSALIGLPLIGLIRLLSNEGITVL